MSDAVVSGRRVLLPSGHVTEFDFAVKQVLEFQNVLVVRLEVPVGEVLNQNVFGISAIDGSVLWQVPEKRNVYEDSPYTGLQRLGSSVVLHGWDGLELTLDPSSGEVLEERHGR